MKRVAVYDLEIKNEISSLKRGWEDHENMGISCLGLYDKDEDRYSIYDDHMKDNFLSLYYCNPEVLLVSFNGLKFDNKVVETNWLQDSPQKTSRCKHYDILHEVWRSLGKSSFHKGVSLGALCENTLFIPKSGSGAFAPQLYKEGRLGELVTYCMHDVWMTKKLFEFILLNGFVMSPEYGKIRVELPYAQIE